MDTFDLHFPIIIYKNKKQIVTAVNLSLIRLDQHGKRSTLSCSHYENSCLP